MTALGIACSDGTLAARGANLANADVGLANANQIQGRHVASVTVAGADATTATITVAYNGTIPNVPDGSTVVYTGTCNQAGGMTWAVAGTMPARFLPRV